MSNIRLRTTPGGEDKFLNLNIDQKFDFIDGFIDHCIFI